MGIYKLRPTRQPFHLLTDLKLFGVSLKCTKYCNLTIMLGDNGKKKVLEV